jgi:hypothetical protein
VARKAEGGIEAMRGPARETAGERELVTSPGAATLPRPPHHPPADAAALPVAAHDHVFDHAGRRAEMREVVHDQQCKRPDDLAAADGDIDVVVGIRPHAREDDPRDRFLAAPGRPVHRASGNRRDLDLGLLDLFRLPAGTIGCTGSLLCGLENESSDIDMVVYGKHWFIAQERVRRGILDGTMDALSPEMWHKVYEKRMPEIPYDQFVLHELRKWNRGHIGGTYFDILYTRSYDNLDCIPTGNGRVIGRNGEKR